MAGKGTVRYADVVLVVTDIEFRGGGILFRASGPGPAPEYHGTYGIYGTDGGLVMSGAWLDQPEAGPGETLRFAMTMPMELNSAWAPGILPAGSQPG